MLVTKDSKYYNEWKNVNIKNIGVDKTSKSVETNHIIQNVLGDRTMRARFKTQFPKLKMTDINSIVDLQRHPINDNYYIAQCLL